MYMHMHRADAHSRATLFLHSFCHIPLMYAAERAVTNAAADIAVCASGTKDAGKERRVVDMTAVRYGRLSYLRMGIVCRSVSAEVDVWDA